MLNVGIGGSVKDGSSRFSVGSDGIGIVGSANVGKLGGIEIPGILNDGNGGRVRAGSSKFRFGSSGIGIVGKLSVGILGGIDIPGIFSVGSGGRQLIVISSAG